MTTLILFIVVCSSFWIDKVACDNDAHIYYSGSQTSYPDKKWSDHFCITYNPKFHSLSTKVNTATVYDLVDLSRDPGCHLSNAYNNNTNVTDKVVAIARGNCTFTEKARVAQDHGAAGILIVSSDMVNPGANQTSDYDTINIVVASIRTADFVDIMKEGPDVEVKLVALGARGLDFTVIIIGVLAVSCVAVGGFWAGKTSTSDSKKSTQIAAGKPAGKTGDSDDADDSDEEPDISITAVIVFFLLVCTFLVLLYFFYDYLVYVVITMFCLAGTIGLFACLEPLCRRIPWEARLPSNRIPLLRQRPLYRDIILGVLCLGVAVVWGIERKARFAWIVQDILGFAFCVNMLKTLRLPNLKICVVLMVLLFFYDIFFVFITPYITSSGESVMVKVATGGSAGSSSGEQIPMVFKVPHLWTACYGVQFSLLGFGDIVVPGLLISYNHRFDVKMTTKRIPIYFISTVIAYAVGLLITFVALYLMGKGQPALLYLVPCTLGTTFVIGCLRGEARSLWAGISKQRNTAKPQSEINTGAPVTTVKSADQSSSDGSSDGGSESRLLINTRK